MSDNNADSGTDPIIPDQDPIIGDDQGEGSGEPAGPTPEEYAREKGWRPKEEFTGNQSEWVDAQEFIRREPLFEKIKGQSKELKKLQKTIEGMVNHYQANVQAQVKQQIDALKAERKEAIELGDADRVDFIEQQIGAAVRQSAPPPPKQDLDEDLVAWVGSPANKWFHEDQEMRDFAVAYNENYLKRNPGKIKESLLKTDDAIRKAYPEKFKRVIPPPSVETGSSGRGGSAKYDHAKLSPEQKLAYRQFVTVNKIMSHDDYFKSLEDIGEYK